MGFFGVRPFGVALVAFTGLAQGVIQVGRICVFNEPFIERGNWGATVFGLVGGGTYFFWNFTGRAFFQEFFVLGLSTGTGPFILIWVVCLFGAIGRWVLTTIFGVAGYNVCRCWLTSLRESSNMYSCPLVGGVSLSVFF